MLFPLALGNGQCRVARGSRLVVLLVGSYLCSEPCLVSRVLFRLSRFVVSAVWVGVRRVRFLCPNFEVPVRDVVVDVC